MGSAMGDTFHGVGPTHEVPATYVRLPGRTFRALGGGRGWTSGGSSPGLAGGHRHMGLGGRMGSTPIRPLHGVVGSHGVGPACSVFGGLCSIGQAFRW